MARKYAYATPASPDELADLLMDPRLADRFSNSPSELFASYARKAIEADPGIADQLREELGQAPGPVRRAVAARSALTTLYDPSAPGAPLNGKATWAGMVQDARSPSGQGQLRRLQNTMSERVPSAGGFAVSEDMRSDMILLALQSAIIRPLATVIPGAALRTSVPVIEEGSHTGGNVLGGMQFEWVPENTALAASVASFGRVTLEAHKLAGYLGGVPNELMEDANRLDAFLRLAIPAGLAFAEDAAMIGGSGAGEPLGALSASCAISVTRQTASSVTLADVAKLAARMLPRSMTSFIWLCSPDVMVQLLELFLNFGSATSGLVAPPGWLTFGGGQWRLLGRPLYSTEFVPELGTRGDLVALDPSFVVIADRQLMQIAVADNGQGFVKDESEIKITERLDSRVWLGQPVSPANSSATLSPVVVLN